MLLLFRSYVHVTHISRSSSPLLRNGKINIHLLPRSETSAIHLSSFAVSNSDANRPLPGDTLFTRWPHFHHRSIQHPAFRLDARFAARTEATGQTCRSFVVRPSLLRYLESRHMRASFIDLLSSLERCEFQPIGEQNHRTGRLLLCNRCCRHFVATALLAHFFFRPARQPKPKYSRGVCRGNPEPFRSDSQQLQSVASGVCANGRPCRWVAPPRNRKTPSGVSLPGLGIHQLVTELPAAVTVAVNFNEKNQYPAPPLRGVGRSVVRSFGRSTASVYTNAHAHIIAVGDGLGQVVLAREQGICM